MGIRLGLIMALVTCFNSTAGAEDVFRACSNITTGRVRSTSVMVNSTPSCRSTETPRTWNQSGSAGSGTSRAYVRSQNFNGGGSIPVTGVGNEVTMLTITLPAGNFLVQGKVEFVNPSGSDADMVCRIADDYGGADAQTVENNRVRNLHPTGVVQLAAPGTVALNCYIGLGYSSQTLRTRNWAVLTAAQVDEITTQP
jgi:hypothetical protein